LAGLWLKETEDVDLDKVERRRREMTLLRRAFPMPFGANRTPLEPDSSAPIRGIDERLADPYIRHTQKNTLECGALKGDSLTFNTAVLAPINGTTPSVFNGLLSNL
jgi:hypothetical protein